MNLNERFLQELSKCTDPVVFLGVAKILKVELLHEEKDENGVNIPRPFDEIVIDVAEAFYKIGRKRKRELLKIFKDANEYNSEEVDTNAVGAKDTSVANKN